MKTRSMNGFLGNKFPVLEREVAEGEESRGARRRVVSADVTTRRQRDARPDAEERQRGTFKKPIGMPWGPRYM